MKLNNKNITLPVIGAVAGFALSYLIFSSSGVPGGGDEEQGEQKPLYWVAPMDANYRRDEPGLSPMGMELVPVYAEGAAGGPDEGPGTIRISPDVVNNLGVRTATAQRKSMNSLIKTVGYVVYDEDKLEHIHPRIEGWIERLYVKASGDPVEAGQPLYDIYSPTLVNAQEELVLALGRNNSQLIKASEDRLRSLQLPENAIAVLKETREIKQTVTFYAPNSGVIDNLNIRQGFFVSPGTTMMSIGNLDQVWVEAEVFERQAAYVEEGIPVSMTVDYLPGETWQGQVDYVQPALDAMTRTLKVRLRFDNKNGALKPNMFTQVALDTEQDQESLLVPKDAVIRTGDNDRVVLALDEGSFKSVAVDVGRVDDQYTEILSGIDAGERVVVSAQFLLDSESSKASDFKRMDHGDQMNDGPTSGWTSGTINEVNLEDRTVNLSHDRIEAFNMMGMTMNFLVSGSVDINTLNEGMTLEVEVSKGDGPMYEITDTKFERQEMDHSQMDHSAMGHDMDEMAEQKGGWTTGKINSVDVDSRKVNVSHGAIKEIPMMAMTMEFGVSQDVDINSLNEGMSLPIEVTMTGEGEFTITDVAIADPANWTDATLNRVDVESRKANFRHAAIKNIGMMAMTMDFNIAQSVDIEALIPGSEVQIIVEMPSEGVFEVTHVRPAPVE
ncbi:efflux RND transporter periplasmic adaptor subunit [Emcibacteraceae bacterium]|nr:efflux RND transporter periplasmic adaptor subunit [Emcibacteraceae bacterium]